MQSIEPFVFFFIMHTAELNIYAAIQSTIVWLLFNRLKRQFSPLEMDDGSWIGTTYTSHIRFFSFHIRQKLNNRFFFAVSGPRFNVQVSWFKPNHISVCQAMLRNIKDLRH